MGVFKFGIELNSKKIKRAENHDKLPRIAKEQSAYNN